MTDKNKTTQTAPGGQVEPLVIPPPSKVNCPHCKKDFAIDLKAKIPPRQVLSIKITTESKYIVAKTLGATIENMAKVLKSIAKDIGIKVEVFIKDVRYKTNEIEVDFLIVSAV